MNYIKKVMVRLLICAVASPLVVTLTLWSITERSSERSVIFTHPEWILYGSLALFALCFIGVWFEKRDEP
jgi:hypothetical protein